MQNYASFWACVGPSVDLSVSIVSKWVINIMQTILHISPETLVSEAKEHEKIAVESSPTGTSK